MSFDPIVQGCDWQATLVVRPTSGRTNADVTEELTEATGVTARLLVNGKVVATFGATVTDAAARTIELTLPHATTTGLAKCQGQQEGVIDVRLALPGDIIRPISVLERVQVVGLTSLVA